VRRKNRRGDASGSQLAQPRIVSAVIAQALSGDTGVARLILERLMPAPRGRPITLKLPAVASAQDIDSALTTLLRAVGAGELSPDEAKIVCELLSAKRESIELAEFDRRLRALEQSAGG
jgi:hypothetical protein